MHDKYGLPMLSLYETQDRIGKQVKFKVYLCYSNINVTLHDGTGPPMLWLYKHQDHVAENVYLWDGYTKPQNISKDTQEMPQSRSKALPSHQKKEIWEQILKDNTNVTYESTDAHTKQNWNRRTALERSVGKPLCMSGIIYLCYTNPKTILHIRKCLSMLWLYKTQDHFAWLEKFTNSIHFVDTWSSKNQTMTEWMKVN